MLLEVPQISRSGLYLITLTTGFQMKWIYFFSILCALSFGNIINSNESESQLQEYANTHKKRICGITDNLNSMNLQILLHDGTLWDCYYESMSDRLCVIKKWRCGQVFHFIGISREFNEAYTTFSIGTGAASVAILHAYLDPQCYNLLPYIIEKTDDSLVILSDGSVWEESYTFFSDMQFWEPGQRVFVSHSKENSYNLFNIDQHEGLFYESRFISAKLIRLNDH